MARHTSVVMFCFVFTFFLMCTTTAILIHRPTVGYIFFFLFKCPPPPPTPSYHQSSWVALTAPQSSIVKSNESFAPFQSHSPSRSFHSWRGGGMGQTSAWRVKAGALIRVLPAFWVVAWRRRAAQVRHLGGWGPAGEDLRGA